MKVKVGNFIEFGKTDKATIYWTLQGETPEEEALITSVYGLKGKRVLTCNKSLEISFTRKVE